jgi:hypothetical protein
VDATRGSVFVFGKPRRGAGSEWRAPPRAGPGPPNFSRLSRPFATTDAEESAHPATAPIVILKLKYKILYFGFGKKEFETLLVHKNYSSFLIHLYNY